MSALEDIATERQRQISMEGWTEAHDDGHPDHDLTKAAISYCWSSIAPLGKRGEPSYWPWHSSWWKPTNTRRDLVKAAALIVAEIERLDRAAATTL